MSDKKRLEEVKKRDTSYLLSGTNLENDWCWLIEQAEKVERYEEFIKACRFAGEGGIPQLRIEANYLLKGETVSADLSKILRKDH